MAQWLTEDEHKIGNEHKSGYRWPLARHTKVIQTVCVVQALLALFSDAGAKYSHLLDA